MVEIKRNNKIARIDVGPFIFKTNLLSDGQYKKLRKKDLVASDVLLALARQIKKRK